LSFNVATRTFMMIPGATCNAAAMIANGGFMPSDYDMEHTGVYVAFGPDSNLPLLCDRLWGGSSLGDCFLLVGLILTLCSTLPRRAVVNT
jgi:hypothetical protein